MNAASLLDHPIFKTVGSVGDEMEMPVYVVGGYVRDAWMKRPGKASKDIDFVCVGSGIELAQGVARKLGKKTDVTVFKNFGTAQIHLDGLELEFVGARRESYRNDSRKPIVEDGTLEDDQLRRDFSINAMAIQLNEAHYGELIDPFNGIDDIKRKIIRTPRDPHVTFADDPLRLMRAVRFASQLNFDIDPVTTEGIVAQAERIKIISHERIT
ncbi:MAG: CCA tRNA nucleotidyltransferase, partial [Bacteroidia bacterium]|nr:CCA tRNA nucleotidyltransferase [Bacteroidia bacterium]